MKVCGLLLVSCLFCLPLCALEIGKHYDFIQKNGQNVLGAELLAEADGDYTIKLNYVPKPITIHASALVRPPNLSKVQPPPKIVAPPIELTKNFSLHASAGYTYATFGPLAPLFRTGYQAHIGSDWLLFKTPVLGIRALTALFGFAMYEQSPRHIQMFSGLLGPKFLIWSLEHWGAAVFASPLAGVSYTSLKGYTFTSDYLTFTAMATISFEKRIQSFVIGAQVYANYLFDSSLDFSSTGISVSVHYPLADANPF